MATPSSTVYRDSAGNLREAYNLPADGGGNAGVPSTGDMDTTGGVVPTWMPHSYTYDQSGNVATDTVTGATGTWVRTYTWTSGALAADSGWVKQ